MLFLFWAADIFGNSATLDDLFVLSVGPYLTAGCAFLTGDRDETDYLRYNKCNYFSLPSSLYSIIYSTVTLKK